jgi:hypothetical protein
MAQDTGAKKPETPPSAPSREDRGSSESGVDRTIKSYQDRLAQDGVQIKRDIADLRKELKEIIDLRFDAALSVAELRAEMGAAGTLQDNAPATTAPGSASPVTAAPTSPATGLPAGAQVVSTPVASQPTQNFAVHPAGGSSGHVPADQKQVLLNQELRQIQNVLRGEVQQARAATDHLVGYLHVLRGQHRQRKAEQKVDEELNKSEAKR